MKSNLVRGHVEGERVLFAVSEGRPTSIYRLSLPVATSLSLSSGTGCWSKSQGRLTFWRTLGALQLLDPRTCSYQFLLHLPQAPFSNQSSLLSRHSSLYPVIRAFLLAIFFDSQLFAGVIPGSLGCSLCCPLRVPGVLPKRVFLGGLRRLCCM